MEQWTMSWKRQRIASLNLAKCHENFHTRNQLLDWCTNGRMLNACHLPTKQTLHSTVLTLECTMEHMVLHLELIHRSTFSVTKACKHLSGQIWAWKSWCQNKHKVFCWLLLRNRLSTRELLRKKNMELEDYSCVLCDSSSDETLVHLLFLLKNQLQVPFFT